MPEIYFLLFLTTFVMCNEFLYRISNEHFFTKLPFLILANAQLFKT